MRDHNFPTICVISDVKFFILQIVSHKCPPSHRWAAEQGQVCCRDFWKESNASLDVSFDDPKEECAGGKFIECPVLRQKNICTADKLSKL